MRQSDEDTAIWLRLMKRLGSGIYPVFSSEADRSAAVDWQLMQSIESIKARAKRDVRKLQLQARLGAPPLE